LPIGITDLEFSSGYSCVYSLTTSEVPYVTNVIKNDSEVESNFVLVGGMSGIGAKGSLAYGLIAADVLLNKDENSGIYLKTKTALGSERLMKDLQDSNE
jgi:glycine/D-amino acid oxidase-like deaminating enzyme